MAALLLQLCAAAGLVALAAAQCGTSVWPLPQDMNWGTSPVGLASGFQFTASAQDAILSAAFTRWGFPNRGRDTAGAALGHGAGVVCRVAKGLCTPCQYLWSEYVWACQCVGVRVEGVWWEGIGALGAASALNL
jgi:hypothetical protein